MGAWLACLILLPVLAFADDRGVSLRLVPDQVKQGGVSALFVDWPGPVRSLRVHAGDREILATVVDGQTHTMVLIGVDLEQAPGPLPLRVEAVDEAGRTRTARGALRVLDAKFPVQRLTLPRTYVELDAATLERVNREKAVLDRLWETLQPQRAWREPFQLPLEGAGPPSGFGLRRIINGEPRAPHTGVDFAAESGAPVLAANAGIVALVDDQFFAGKAIVLDHGLGLFTMYFHLQESLVQPGRRVGRGQIIGRAGSTGRATGPHLHWGARLHGARINPRELLRQSPLE